MLALVGRGPALLLCCVGLGAGGRWWCPREGGPVESRTGLWGRLGPSRSWSSRWRPGRGQVWGGAALDQCDCGLSAWGQVGKTAARSVPVPTREACPLRLARSPPRPSRWPPLPQQLQVLRVGVSQGRSGAARSAQPQVEKRLWPRPLPGSPLGATRSGGGRTEKWGNREAAGASFRENSLVVAGAGWAFWPHCVLCAPDGA